MKRTVLALALVCGLSAAHAATPTVAEVDNLLIAGKYDEAKKELKDVLKQNPDSIVANQYMLEIMKVQYAYDQKPSLEYKYYENQVQQAEQAKVAKENNLRKERLGTALGWFLMVFLFVLAGFIIYFTGAYKYLLESYNAWGYKRECAKRQQGFIVELASLDTRLVKAKGAINSLTDYSRGMVKAAYDDNIDALRQVKDLDYNIGLVDNHIGRTQDFLQGIGY